MHPDQGSQLTLDLAGFYVVGFVAIEKNVVYAVVRIWIRRGQLIRYRTDPVNPDPDTGCVVTCKDCNSELHCLILNANIPGRIFWEAIKLCGNFNPSCSSFIL